MIDFSAMLVLSVPVSVGFVLGLWAVFHFRNKRQD
jgi:hypothetical protein